jgi:hypothetical protein
MDDLPPPSITLPSPFQRLSDDPSNGLPSPFLHPSNGVLTGYPPGGSYRTPPEGIPSHPSAMEARWKWGQP